LRRDPQWALMAAMYVVRKTPAGKYSVAYAQTFSAQQLQAQLADLLKNGWGEEEANAEVACVPRTFATCNEDADGYSLECCSSFIASLIQAGDIISIPDQQFATIVQGAGRA
jgi:hypothetical protein